MKVYSPVLEVLAAICAGLLGLLAIVIGIFLIPADSHVGLAIALLGGMGVLASVLLFCMVSLIAALNRMYSAWHTQFSKDRDLGTKKTDRMAYSFSPKK